MTEATTIPDLAHKLDIGAPASDQVGDGAQALRFAWMPIRDLAVDAAYQRLISTRGRQKIAKIAKEFDWARFGALQVAEAPDGDTLSVMDGQHRALAAYLAGVSAVPCLIVQAQLAEQAQAFVGINTVRSSVASIDKFRARVAAGDEAAVTVAEILRDLEIDTDVTPGTPLKPRQTRAATQLERLVKMIGRGLTYTTLELLTDAQPETPNLLTSFAVMATGMAVKRITDADGDIDRFAKLLEETDFETVKDEAQQLTKLQGGQQFPHGANRLIAAYNRGLQKKVA